MLIFISLYRKFKESQFSELQAGPAVSDRERIFRSLKIFRLLLNSFSYWSGFKVFHF